MWLRPALDTPRRFLGTGLNGVDRSQVMLDHARELAGASGQPIFAAADFRELPFDAEAFDVVLNLFSLLGYYGRGSRSRHASRVPARTADGRDARRRADAP